MNAKHVLGAMVCGLAVGCTEPRIDTTDEASTKSTVIAVGNSLPRGEAQGEFAAALGLAQAIEGKGKPSASPISKTYRPLSGMTGKDVLSWYQKSRKH